MLFICTKCDGIPQLSERQLPHLQFPVFDRRGCRLGIRTVIIFSVPDGLNVCGNGFQF